MLPKSKFPIRLVAPRSGRSSTFQPEVGLDLNLLITGGSKEVLVYEVEGETVGSVPPGSLVAVDVASSPQAGDVAAFFHNDEVCVTQIEEGQRHLRLVGSESPRRNFIGVVRAAVTFFGRMPRVGPSVPKMTVTSVEPEAGFKVTVEMQDDSGHLHHFTMDNHEVLRAIGMATLAIAKWLKSKSLSFL